MRRFGAIICVMIGFSMFLLCGNVWADVSGADVQPGDVTPGGGSYPSCTPGTPVHMKPCGSNGGGKSWRIYKITDAVKNASNDDKVGKLNKDARWYIVEGFDGAKSITGSNGILSKCAKRNASFVLLLGLNELIVGQSKKHPDFYVAFNQTEPNGVCWPANRGCYYNWNNDDAITDVETIKSGSFKNGQAVIEDIAKGLFVDYKKKYPNDIKISYIEAGGFCAWDADSEKVTLTLYAKDSENGNTLNDGKSISEDAVEKGEKATVSRAKFDNGKAKEDGYVFKNWSESSCDSNSKKCSVSNMKADKKIYAYYSKKFTLTAKSVDEDGNSLANVTGLGDKTVADVWRGDSASITHGTTDMGYTFIGWRTTVKGDISNKNETYVVQALSSNTTVYAVYRPFSSETSLTIKVKNNNVAKYNTLSESVYAKPGDKLTFVTEYEPGAQASMNIKPQKFVLDLYDPDSNEITSKGTPVNVNGTTALSTILNNQNGDRGKWGNTIVFSGLLNGKGPGKYNPGVTEKKTVSHDREMGFNEVGRECEDKNGVRECKDRVGKVKTQNDTQLDTPRSVSVSLDGGKSLATVSAGLGASAMVKVPYNYVTSNELVGISNGVAAGGMDGVKYKVKVEPKRNELTTNNSEDSYATLVERARTGVIVYYPGEGEEGAKNGNSGVGDGSQYDVCRYFGYEAGSGKCDFFVGHDYVKLNDSNSRESLNGSEIEHSVDVVYRDLPAGTRVCVAVANYPSTSGRDDNYTEPEGDKKWNISDSNCDGAISKKPIIQILGGNVYSGGAIETGLSRKSNWGTDGNTHVFGSWGELGVISYGEVRFDSGNGFASGASLAGEGGWSGGGVPCSVSPLTFANCTKNEDGSTSNKIGSVGTEGAISGIDKDRDGIINLVEKVKEGNNKKDDCFFEGDGLGKDRIIACQKDTINVSDYLGSDIGEGDIKIVYNSENIKIVGDKEDGSDNSIIVGDSIPISDLRKTPKLIIYAGDTIEIGCNMKRIDAVLIAKMVNTCNSGDINSIANSNQLIINGAVIAEKLEANRTYGAGPGEDSGVPAEIINFDPSLYLWSTDNGNEEKKESTHDIVTTYIRELAPRY